jgi:ankyrin repeat protein
MDAKINVRPGTNVDSPSPNVKGDATQSHEPSSIIPGGSGSFFWSESAADSPDQALKSPQSPTELAQVGPEILTDGTTRNDPGIGSYDSTDNSLAHDSNQKLLTSLLGCFIKARGHKDSMKGISEKVRRVLQEQPNIDVNELIDGQSILHVACRYGQLQLLKDVLKRPNANVNVMTRDGLAGLHIACHQNNPNVAVVKTLLQSTHIDVNIRDGATFRTPLHVAALQGNHTPMKMLLDKAETDLQSKDLDGYLPVHYAAAHPIRPRIVMFAEDDKEDEDDSDDILLRLCEIEDINARTHQEQGLLHLAAQAGNTTALKVFLAQPGLDINMVDAHGDTALHLVEDTIVAGMLLDKGIDANIQNADGNTALHSALVERCMTGLADLLLHHTKLDGDLPNKKGEQFMHLAAAKWGIETFNRVTAKCLPRSGNVQAANGETVLHIAARVGDIDIIKRLLDIPGIDLNVQDEVGQSPLHLSCGKGHISVVQTLLNDPFTHINARDAWRQTPLHLACKEGHLEIVRLLLNHFHVDVEAADLRGWTPLHYASQSALGEPIVRALLPFTLDIDKQGLANGETALHVAALGGHFSIVRSLLEQGADPRITCTGLVGSDGVNGQDAAGVASKIEIVDLIRHYRWRKVSIIPDPLSDSQKTLLKSHASGVYISWVWPRNEDLPDGHGDSPRRRRRRIFPDIRPVHDIYDGLENHSLFDASRWQLRSSSLNEKKGPHDLIITERQRATKWVHFSAQSVSNIKPATNMQSMSSSGPRK